MRTLLALTAGLVLLAPAACDSSPRLRDRSDPGAVIDELARRRTEAARLAREAERVESSNPARAVELYREALGLDDTLHNAWNNLGLLLLEQANYADAVAAFQVASDLMPTDPRPPYNIGLAYQRNGWGEEAFRHFALALERDPSHLPSMRGYVRAAEMTGRADERLVGVIRAAMLRETDQQWKDYLQRQRYRVEAVLNLED